MARPFGDQRLFAAERCSYLLSPVDVQMRRDQQDKRSHQRHGAGEAGKKPKRFVPGCGSRNGSTHRAR